MLDSGWLAKQLQADQDMSKLNHELWFELTDEERRKLVGLGGLRALLEKM